MELFFIAAATALIVSFLCSLLEATLLSLTPSQVAELSVRSPHTAQIWHRFKQNIERPIAVILILNTSAHTIGASIAGAQFEEIWGGKWLFAFSLLLTYLMLQFTEILPKSIGVAWNRELALVIARPLALLVRLFSPVAAVIHFVNRPFERRESNSGHTAISEIIALVSMARTANVIDPQQTRLILAASRLPEMRVRQIMTPRTDVVYVRTDQTLTDCLRVVQSSPHSRLPLCKSSIDEVIGLIHVRDLLNRLAPVDDNQMQMRNAGDLVMAIRRNVPFVPQTLAVSKLLRMFKESRTHLAIVIDEHGATVGVVSLEDILRQIVGDIHDEFRPLTLPDFAEEAGSYQVAGRYSLAALADRLQLSFDDADVTTLSGYIMKQLQRLPEPGDSIVIGPFEATVLSVSRRRIDRVSLRPLEKPAST